MRTADEPRRVECGAPDFVISRAPGAVTIGYVETKDVGGKLARNKHGAEALPKLLADFLSHSPQPIATPKELAERMARLTHLIRDIVVEAFERDKASPLMRDLRGAFAKTLIPDLDRPEKTGEFADMYAQTIAYGLFSARAMDVSPGFTRQEAQNLIPKTNPFLRKFFYQITGPDMDEESHAGFVDDLVQLLDHADMGAILEHFGRRTRREDPVVHFYETFLTAYDPKLRQTRGVYYTPEPVVSYIVRSVDALLKTHFRCSWGLAEQNKNIYILDPAAGTATFLYFVVQQIHDSLVQMGQRGVWPRYVDEYLLPRVFGFELLMAPYAVAHMKLGVLFRETGYDFGGKQRLGIYLTNTLEEAEQRVETLFGWRMITEEAEEASHIKRDLPIMVILGNPPYSGHSANRSWETNGEGKRVPTFIGQLVRDYYFVDGKPLGERNPKWLQDDYVKFIRWGQWRIAKTGAGALAFISNHGYLDNPTFRGMRQQLMQAFTDIYVLDLHGNVKKKETAPDGSEDKNVFDIQQGVAIGIFVKEPGKSGPAHVHHADLWGPREGKYRRLFEMEVATTPWKELSPQSPFYLFVPRDVNLQAEYDQGWKVTDIFPMNSVGIVTARDHLTIHWSPDEMWDTVRDFVRPAKEEARERYALGKDARDWKVHLAQEDVQASGPDRRNVVPILYRPFDVRHTYYTGQTRGFLCMPRPDVMRHMLAGKNRAFHLCRQIISDGWQHILATNHITDDSYVSNKTRERGYTLPLYLFSEQKKEKPLRGGGRVFMATLFESQPEYMTRRANLAPGFIAAVSEQLGLEFMPTGKGDLQTAFGPEDVFHYIYAIFHSPTYRERYAEFLKTDFPRVPLTSDLELFRALAAKGEELAALHLLESPSLEALITQFPADGDNEVTKVWYQEPHGDTPGRVYVNKTQYFEGVPPEVWEFQVGGYQVCEKWLKDRRGRRLSGHDVLHYQQIVVALKETIRLMGEIDEAIPSWPIE